jgi:hypothetical protein
MERPRATWRVIAVAGVAFVSACSASETAESQADTTDSEENAVAAADDDELFTEREEVTAVDDEGQPVEPVTESLPPVAETGVPGIESEDAFCRAWSTYAGSVQAISLAWALQGPPEAARLEVAATAALTQAVEGMSDELPAEIEANRQALTADVPGPFLRRADRSRALLTEAGLGEDQIDALGRAWVAAITEQGVESETLFIEVAPDSATALDIASQAFADELPSVNEDPTLDTTEFDIGPSLDYISANCPDQGTLAGNDVIDSGGA